MDKPRLALSMESFNDEDNAYHIIKNTEFNKILYKRESVVEELCIEDAKVCYSSKDITLSFSAGESIISYIQIDNRTGIIPDFRKYLTMKYILESVPDHPIRPM